MENICRFKKRMVYPENLCLDQVARKGSRISDSSWCNEPLEEDAGNRNSGCTLSNQSNENLSANRQFIQDRMRHLVDAFTSRAQAARQRIETPATPSSISSRETVEPPPATIKQPPPPQQSEKVEEPVVQTEAKTFLQKAREIYDNQVINPNGKTYVVWMSVAAMAVLYNAWVIPLRSTFPYQTASNRAFWMTFDYVADLIYVVDVFVVQPRIMYLQEGFWIRDICSTRQNYFQKKAFKFDVLSLLPLDLLYILVGPDYVILRLPRFLKMNTFWDYFSFVDKLLASPYIIRISKTLMYMMYLIHLNACAYYAFSAYEGIGKNSFVFNGKGNAYIRCFYFATKTATSIGKNPKPTQEFEYIFMTFSWLMGVFVFALLIGQIRDIIATATRSQTEYRKLVDETLEYMRRLNLPQEMQRRVQLWFNYTWETQHTLDENNIMDCLPHKMKTDIAINVHIQILSKVKLFADCDEALLRELVLQLKSVMYLPGDIVCKKGDVGKEMYIVQSGQVEVIGRSVKEVLATLSEGSVFGEISLLGIEGMNRRTADVRAKGYANLFVLSKADLNAALSHYPEAQELLNKKAKLLMKKNAALERKNNAMIVIDNPTPAPKQAKFLETVMQMVPPDSNANKLLRYGSRGWTKRRDVNGGGKVRYRNSFSTMRDYGSTDSTFLAKVTVHRTMS